MKDKITIPNILSAYRLFVFPILLYFEIKHFEKLFAIFLIINLFTDILDGWIARRFNMQTEFGARLDSIADFGTYILAITGVFIFKLADFQPHLIIFYIFIILFITSQVLSLIKFGRFPSLHLYSWKIGGYIQGVFFAYLFALGFSVPFFYLTMIWGIIAFTEHIVIQVILPEMRSNQKGMYWVLKRRK
jgi:cardiolipin synthase (CMP-forming)